MFCLLAWTNLAETVKAVVLAKAAIKFSKVDFIVAIPACVLKKEIRNSFTFQGVRIYSFCNKLWAIVFFDHSFAPF